MSLSEQIARDLTGAMKARDAPRTSVLRMAKAALRNREIELRRELADAEVVRVLQQLVKQREESALQFRKGNRPELADKEEGEIAVLRTYLPEEASAAEIEAAVAAAVAETGAQGPKDLGRVMKAALAALGAQGRAVDGRKVNEAVRSRLTG